MDPFLRQLARTAHDTIQHEQQQHAAIAAEKEITERKEEDSGRMEDDAQPTTDSDAAAAVAAPAASAPRDLSFLQLHVSLYQRRIEDVLGYLQEQRFGRPAGSAATAAVAALRRPAAELAREVRSLEAEWATWQLMVELRCSDETVHAQPIPPSLAERYSPQLVAARLVGTPLHPLRRALHILHWLEELQVFLLRIESNGDVSWRRSLRRLQKSTSGDTQRDYLDPDVELRLRKAGALKPGQTVLDPQDAEEEQRMLEYVWALIRAGRLGEAIGLCRNYGQHWRAASLQGGERCHDEGDYQPDGSVWRVGNPTRLLWRHACRALAGAAGVSAVERSIYGLLGGDLPAALSFTGQQQYDDALYCYLKLMVDEEVEQFVAGQEGKGEPAATVAQIPRPANAHLVPRSLSAVLSALESPLNSSVTPAVHTQATQNPYIRLQKWLMLGDTEQAEQEMVRTIRQQYQPQASGQQQLVPAGGADAHTVSHTYLLFAVHVYLYLHPSAPHAEPLNAAGCFLVHSYLSYLETQPAQHQLVPAYAQYLPSAQRVSFYVRFLQQRIPSLAQRQALLAAFEEYCPASERLEVTRNLVSNILGDEQEDKANKQQQLLLPAGTNGAERALAGAFDATSGAGIGSGVSNLLSIGGVVSASDQAKITAIDCFDLASAAVDSGSAEGAAASLSVLTEALAQCTALFRALVWRDKFAAAKRFAQHLIDKKWDSYIYAIVQQQQKRNVQLSSEWSSLEREYAHWKLYIRCLNWYDAWLTQHSSRPVAPVFHPAAYTLPSQAAQARAEYALFARKYAAYEQSLAAWSSEARDTVKDAAGVFTELLQMESGGWMTPTQTSTAPEEMNHLRTKCVPALVDMIVQICMHAEQFELALGVADLLASPLYRLHECFAGEQVRALLARFRTAYIKVHLQPVANAAAHVEAQPAHS